MKQGGGAGHFEGKRRDSLGLPPQPSPTVSASQDPLTTLPDRRSPLNTANASSAASGWGVLGCPNRMARERGPGPTTSTVASTTSSVVSNPPRERRAFYCDQSWVAEEMSKRWRGDLGKSKRRPPAHQKMASLRSYVPFVSHPTLSPPCRILIYPHRRVEFQKKNSCKGPKESVRVP